MYVTLNNTVIYQISLDPSLLMLHPSLAESMIEYRFNHIYGAQQKAKSYNPPYNGTMFPWESAFSGDEVCPTSAPTGQLEQVL